MCIDMTKPINEQSLEDFERCLKDRLTKLKVNLEKLTQADDIFNQEICDICFSTAKEIERLGKELQFIQSNLGDSHPFYTRFRNAYDYLDKGMKQFELS